MTTQSDMKNYAWGTLEELLLACAVNRHGTKSWDSIAMEIQNRSSNPDLLTPQNCKQKYHDLKRRFVKNVKLGDSGDELDKLLPMVDELKRLRVAELRREVQRHDVSIVTLQLQVKRLEEERERSLNAREEEEAGPDLKEELDRKRTGEEEKVEGGEPGGTSPENDVGKSLSDELGRSFNESNSTNPKGNNRRAGLEKPEIKREPVGTGGGEPDRVGTVNDVAHGLSFNCCLSGTKRRRRDGVPTLSSSGEEQEVDVISPAIKRADEKSQALFRFLETIRSHKLCSVFERRLRSQDSPKYKNLIRQHMDLETVQARLEEGTYSECTHKFYRDLLVLFNNAIIFFDKTSSEHITAQEIRKLVMKETPTRTQRHRDFPPKPDPTKKPDSSHVKPVSSSPLVVCRKRSSAFANKADNAEKPKTADGQLLRITKKRTSERSGKVHNGDNTAAKVKKEIEVTVAKKQGAASFLKRIKQNSPVKEKLEDGVGEEKKKKKKGESWRDRKSVV